MTSWERSSKPSSIPHPQEQPPTCPWLLSFSEQATFSALPCPPLTINKEQRYYVKVPFCSKGCNCKIAMVSVNSVRELLVLVENTRIKFVELFQLEISFRFIFYSSQKKIVSLQMSGMRKIQG